MTQPPSAKKNYDGEHIVEPQFSAMLRNSYLLAVRTLGNSADLKLRPAIRARLSAAIWKFFFSLRSLDS